MNRFEQASTARGGVGAPVKTLSSVPLATAACADPFHLRSAGVPLGFAPVVHQEAHTVSARADRNRRARDRRRRAGSYLYLPDAGDWEVRIPAGTSNEIVHLAATRHEAESLARQNPGATVRRVTWKFCHRINTRRPSP